MTDLRRPLAPLLLSLLVAAGTVSAADGVDSGPVIESEGATFGRLGDSAAVNPEEYKFSAAESRLWLADHLRNITQPTRLKYDFVKSGTYEEGFSDVVLLNIKQLNDDGSKNADMQFFTGERSQPFSPDSVTEIRGNPILGLYMRGDVYDMNRLTDGSWRYFQRRIKLALSETATVEPVEIEFAGKKVKAEIIVITPYAKDPHAAQWATLAASIGTVTLAVRRDGDVETNTMELASFRKLFR